MMSFESSSLCEISSKYFFHSRMKRGGRLSGPKRSTQEGKSTRVSYVGIEKPFVKTFATVLLTSLVPESPT